MDCNSMSAGSTPVTVSIFAPVAQPVERRSEEPGVASSTLAGGTIPLRLMAGHRSLTPIMEVRAFQREPGQTMKGNDNNEQKISKHTKNMEDRTY